MTTTSAPSKQSLPDSGWTWIYDAIIERIAEIGIAAFSVYVALAMHANNETRQCFPSISRLVKLTGLSKRSVHRAVEVLKKHGLITVTPQRSDKGGSKSNLYTLSPIVPGDKIAPPVPDCHGGSDKIAPPPGDKNDTGGSDTRAPLTRPIDITKPNINQTQGTNLSSAKADSIPAGLLELIDSWNALGNQIVMPGNGARRDPPAKALLTGWKQAIKNPEQRDFFKDIPAVVEKIKAAKYCHGQGWFTLPWLCGKTRSKEYAIERLMVGAYTGENKNGNGKRDTTPGPGQRHPADIRENGF